MNTPEYRLKAIRHLEEMGWAPEGNKDFWRGVSKNERLVGVYTPVMIARENRPDVTAEIWDTRWKITNCRQDNWQNFTDDQVIDLWLHITMEGL